MAVQGNLLSTINPAGLPGDEIATFVHAFFGSACHSDDAKVVRCPMHPPYAVRMQYDKKGNLTGVFAESSLTQKTLTELQERLHAELVADVGIGFRREVLFSSARVEGCWRYTDLFQILPVPEYAPRPAGPSGAHPFLLECKYQKTGDFLTNVRRWSRRVRRVQLLLNGLLFPEVEWPGFKSVGNRGRCWVQLPPAAGETVGNTAYYQRTYCYEGYNPQPDGFSPLDGIPAMPTLSSERYYAGLGDGPEAPLHIGGGVSFYVPEDLGRSIDLFFQLPDLDRDRFWRACYWLGEVINSSSFSVRLQFEVQAIESLVPTQSRAACKACGQLTGPGPSALFKAFLNRYAPAAVSDAVTSKDLYKARSGMTHGSGLFLVDLDEMGDFTPMISEQRQQSDAGFYRSRRALYNWLHNPGEQAEQSAIDAGENHPASQAVPDRVAADGRGTRYLLIVVAAVVVLLFLLLLVLFRW